jgi:hypothetical protein
MRVDSGRLHTYCEQRVPSKAKSRLWGQHVHHHPIMTPMLARGGGKHKYQSPVGVPIRGTIGALWSLLRREWPGIGQGSLRCQRQEENSEVAW